MANLAAGREDTGAADRDSHAMQSRPAPASFSPETASQAGAGALLVTIAVVELWLAFWAAGWWHRCGASLVAVVGAALLVRAVAAIALPPRTEPARRVRRRQPEPPPARAGRVVLAD